MQIDGQEITVQRIDELIETPPRRPLPLGSNERANLRDSCRRHAPTLAAQDEVRVFAFGPNQATAAFLSTLRGSTFAQIPWEELRQQLQQGGELPTLDELEQDRAELKTLTTYRGLRKLFSAKPKAKILRFQLLQVIDTDAIHSILSGMDTTLGSTDRGEFVNLRLSANKPLIETELRHITQAPVTWTDKNAINRNEDGVLKLAAAKAAGGAT